MNGEPHRRALEQYPHARVGAQAFCGPADQSGLLAAIWVEWVLEDAGVGDRAAFVNDQLVRMEKFAAAIAERARHPFFRSLATVIGEPVGSARP
ncbi:MAG: hypothetical protein RMI94_11545 [Bryobacterales bacterium]|nr:hypothetical protein [Bryobacteraceae bacterium]MDW8131176.1 hypothetical protein [Bryobacterales bacterium]